MSLRHRVQLTSVRFLLRIQNPYPTLKGILTLGSQDFPYQLDTCGELILMDKFLGKLPFENVCGSLSFVTTFCGNFFF